MSHFLDRLTYFAQPARDLFRITMALTNGEDRTWEDAYRDRWAHDKIVRSTHERELHGLLLVEDLRQPRHRHLETQQTDYPRARPANHENRGCGAPISWYLYSANRVKYPMVRGRLCSNTGALPLPWPEPCRSWTPGPPSSRTTVRGATGSSSAAWAASCAAPGTKSTR